MEMQTETRRKLNPQNFQELNIKIAVYLMFRFSLSLTVMMDRKRGCFHAGSQYIFTVQEKTDLSFWGIEYL